MKSNIFVLEKKVKFQNTGECFEWYIPSDKTYCLP